MTTALAAVANRNQGRVDLTATVSGTYAQAVYVEVQRSDDGGRTWGPVRGNSPSYWNLVVVTAGVARLVDAECPFDTALAYRARAVDVSNATNDTWSAVVAVTLLSPPGGDWVVAPVTNPAYVTTVWIRGQDSYDRADPVGVFYALGRRDPILTAGTRRSATGPLIIDVPNRLTRLRLENLLDTYDLFCVRAPAGHGWDVRYVQFGDVTFKRQANRPVEFWDLDTKWWSVVQPLVPVTRYTITYGDVRANYGTYAELVTTFATYDDLRGAEL